MEIYREITPLTENDCFMIFSREKKRFDFPLHIHPEYELNLILNAKGAQRIIGSHVEEIDGVELVLVGPDVTHGWFNGNCGQDDDIHEITIQFDSELFNERFLQRNQMASIRRLLHDAKRGVLFSKTQIEMVAPKIKALIESSGFFALIQFMSILYDLSLSIETKLLSDTSFGQENIKSDSRRVEQVFKFMNSNYRQQIKLQDVAAIAKMSEVAFSRYIKKHTGVSFIDSLNEIRIGHVSRMLIDTNQTVSEIAFSCGFNNMANFNRIFKKKKKLTPNEFRNAFIHKKVYV